MPRQSLILPSPAEPRREDRQGGIEDQAEQGEIGPGQPILIAERLSQDIDHEPDPLGEEIMRADPGRHQRGEREVEERRMTLATERRGVQREPEEGRDNRVPAEERRGRGRRRHRQRERQAREDVSPEPNPGDAPGVGLVRGRAVAPRCTVAMAPSMTGTA